MEDITSLFNSAVENDTRFKEAANVIKNNSLGNIWLIGGFVFRTLAQQLYGAQKASCDFDFIVESPVDFFQLPDNYSTEFTNRFGNPKFISRNGIIIDYIPLENIHSIREHKLQPTFDNFLSNVPLNIQAIAYDFDAQYIIGNPGIDALERKTVSVHNLHFAKQAAKRKRISLYSYIKEKADSLGFSADFSNI